MLGTDYIETGESANFSLLSADTVTSRISYMQQHFTEQRPKVTGLQSNLPVLETSDLLTYGDLKSELYKFTDTAVEFYNIIDCRQLCTNRCAVYFNRFFNEMDIIRYNLGVNCLEYIADKHAFNCIPYISESQGLIAVETNKLTTIFQLRQELTTRAAQTITAMETTNHIYSGISTFNILPRCHTVSDLDGLFATQSYEVTTKRHLDREFQLFLNRPSTFTQEITLTYLLLKTIPSIEQTYLFVDNDNQLVPKAHLDREISRIKTDNHIIFGQYYFKQIPRLALTNPIDFNQLISREDEQLVTKYHIDKISKRMHGSIPPIYKSGTASTSTNSEVTIILVTVFPYPHTTYPIHITATITYPTGDVINNQTTIYITDISSNYFRYQVKKTVGGVTSNCESQVKVCYQCVQYSYVT